MTAAANKALVLKVMNALFVDRNLDQTKLDAWWHPDYIQHNPTIHTGSNGLLALVASLPTNFKYEHGMVVADGDIVMIHGKYSNWMPKPLIAVDIFRVQNGKLAEHWDVLQDEVPIDRTPHGNPMFTAVH